MKILRHTLLAGVLCLTPIYAQPTCLIVEGHYLWHCWKGTEYEKSFPSWIGFEKKVADLNNLPDWEESYLYLSPDTELKLPSSSNDELEAEIESVRRSQVRKELETEFAKAKKDLEAQIEKLKKAPAPKNSSWSSFMTLLAAISTFVALVLAFLLAKRKKQGSELMEDNVELQMKVRDLDEDVERLKKDVVNIGKERDVYNHFLRRYAYPYTLPSDIGSVLGKSQTLYLLRASDDEVLGPESEVMVFRDGTQVSRKIKNLTRYFDEAARDFDEGKTDIFDFYGIVRSSVRPRVKPSSRETKEPVVTT